MKNETTNNQRQSRTGERLIGALQEALYDAEEKIELRTTHPKINPVIDAISADEIRSTRNQLGLSQAMFALVIGVSKRTVESWETGRYAPDGAARRLITVMQKDPEFPQRYKLLEKV